VAKRALITGLTGQDGSFLAELLLDKGYEVYGLKRRTSTNSDERIAHLLSDVKVIDGDLIDSSSLLRAVQQCQPDEVYNLGAQSFVQTSFVQPELTMEVTGVGVLRLLEAVRTMAPKAKFYQASTSEMFGGHPPPQSDETPFYPKSPYGVAKLYGHWMVVNYRESYGMFACSGILFNHESMRRGYEFVTQKIARGAAAIKLGMTDKLFLGNLEAKRDWGHAKDFVEAMWLMLQQEAPEDYVIATGEAHTVREFVDLAFKRLGMNYEDHVVVDQKFFRPAEVNYLLGDCSKATRKLGWKPKVSFDELVFEMVDHAYAHPEEWAEKHRLLSEEKIA
jgi:GDPmannose 4,6-dehydratase